MRDANWRSRREKEVTTRERGVHRYCPQPVMSTNCSIDFSRVPFSVFRWQHGITLGMQFGKSYRPQHFQINFHDEADPVSLCL